MDNFVEGRATAAPQAHYKSGRTRVQSGIGRVCDTYDGQCRVITQKAALVRVFGLCQYGTHRFRIEGDSDISGGDGKGCGLAKRPIHVRRHKIGIIRIIRRSSTRSTLPAPA